MTEFIVPLPKAVRAGDLVQIWEMVEDALRSVVKPQGSVFTSNKLGHQRKFLVRTEVRRTNYGNLPHPVELSVRARVLVATGGFALSLEFNEPNLANLKTHLEREIQATLQGPRAVSSAA